MADEPSDEPVAHATAHEGNGDRELHLACNNLSDSDAAIIDGATERLCQPTTLSSGTTDLGLEPALTRAVAEAPSASAEKPVRTDVPLSSARIGIEPVTPGPDHPSGVGLVIAHDWFDDAAGDSAKNSGDARLTSSDAAGAAAAAPPVFDAADKNVPLRDGPDGLAVVEVGTSSLLEQKSADGLDNRLSSDATDALPAPTAEATRDLLHAVEGVHVTSTRGRSSRASPSGVPDSILDPRSSPAPLHASGGVLVERRADAASSRVFPPSAFSRVRAARGAPTENVALIPRVQMART